MWYEKAYRRHLCDMHIEDWNDDFLRDFSPEQYLSCLKKANIQNAMLYFQSHVGYCYYPTATGHMHKAFVGRETMMKDLAAACRREGIFVTGYYSLNYNTWAHDTHPDWRMITGSGKSSRENREGDMMSCSSAQAYRYGLCCPNNEEYRHFVYAQMAEINDYFEFDGMFFDMPFWPHMCYCPSCQKRWAEEVGGDIPQEQNWNDPRWLLHMEKRRGWMGEFVQEVTKRMKLLRPGISVEHNFADAVLNNPTVCCAEPVNEGCDYAGGDLYGGILEQSFTCKFYYSITKHQPFEYMMARCTPNLSSHTVTKSYDQMMTSVGLTAAHHGATLVIDAIDPVGTLDERVYERFGRVFQREMPYEKYFHGQMIADVGVYFSLRSKFHRNGRDYSNQDCCVNTVKNMITHHIPVGVTGGFSTLEQYPVLVVPCLTEEDVYDADRLVAYVQNGGTLYMSGAECPVLMKRLLEAELIEYKDAAMAYVAPCEGVDFGWYNARYPLSFMGWAPIVKAPKDGVIATITMPYTEQADIRYASIHSYPPGIATEHPAIISKAYGKGRVIWSALPLENSENEEYRALLLKLLGINAPSVKCSASPDTELVLFKEEQGILLSAVVLNESYASPAVMDFEVSVLCDAKPEKVLLLPQEKPIEFNWDGETVTFKVENMNIFAMYRICL